MSSVPVDQGGPCGLSQQTDQGPPGGHAWGGGAAGTSISLPSPVPMEPLAASVAHHPLPGAAPAPGGKQAGARWVLCPSGAPRAARRPKSYLEGRVLGLEFFV